MAHWGGASGTPQMPEELMRRMEARRVARRRQPRASRERTIQARSQPAMDGTAALLAAARAGDTAEVRALVGRPNDSIDANGASA